jgi:hypothetical protein
VFRRRRQESADQSGDERNPRPGEAAAGEAVPTRAGPGGPGHASGPGEAPAATTAASRRGPWDAAGEVPPADRIDLGSLQVPVAGDLEIQVSMTEDQAAWVTVVRGASELQLQAFAAPKSGGLWEEVRSEIAQEVVRSGGQAEEADGPFGQELRARIPAGGRPGTGAKGPLEPVRFLGVDGPRWFLRGVISGPAARNAELARPLEEVFAGVVVVRGEHPVPPRDLLEIRLPAEAREALAEQAGQAGGRFQLPDPCQRGPEITETR